MEEAIERGEGPEALTSYDQQSKELEGARNLLGAARAYRAIVYMNYYLGKYPDGIRAAHRGLALLKHEPVTQDLILIQVQLHDDAARSYLELRDLETARGHALEALELKRGFTSWGRERYWTAVLLRRLAAIDIRQEKHRDAIRRGIEAIAILDDLLTRAPRGYQDYRRQIAWTATIVGSAYVRLNDLGEAEKYLRRAMAEYSRSGTSTSDWGSLSWLGVIELRRGNYEEALKHFEAVVEIGRRQHRIAAMLYGTSGIARAHHGSGRLREALAARQNSLKLLEDIRSQIQDVGLRGAFLEDKEGFYYGAILTALRLQEKGEAFSFAERFRARAFLDLLGSQTTLSKGLTRALLDEEGRLRAQLAEARALDADARGERPSPMTRQKVEAAERAYRAFLDRVRKENLEQASLMTVEPVSASEVQAILPEGTTLLEFLLADKETIIWVLDRQGLELLRLPIPRVTFVGEVRAFRQALEGLAPLEMVEQRARALYDRLLAPAKPYIKGDRLLIVPHDILHYLPFGALRTPEGRWLIEDFTISTLPSASVLKFLPEKERNAQGGIMAVGNPEVGPALHLRYAEREARAIGQRFNGATVLLRQDATETKAKALGEAAGILHFATHGELNERDPLSSALLLVPEGKEDGRLEVREVFGLDLKAKLVVLSACETGLGQLSKGDELVGLQRAFLYAGTPAVVTTLWKVDDRASYYLMRAFYEHLNEQAPAAALRAAQREIMRDYPHPFAWAGFGLTGVPR